MAVSKRCKHDRRRAAEKRQQIKAWAQEKAQVRKPKPAKQVEVGLSDSGDIQNHHKNFIDSINYYGIIFVGMDSGNLDMELVWTGEYLYEAEQLVEKYYFLKKGNKSAFLLRCSELFHTKTERIPSSGWYCCNDAVLRLDEEFDKHKHDSATFGVDQYGCVLWAGAGKIMQLFSAH